MKNAIIQTANKSESAKVHSIFNKRTAVKRGFYFQLSCEFSKLMAWLHQCYTKVRA